MPATSLSTDLYELAMMAGYVADGRHERTRATFELFVRRLPRNRNYLIAAGLEQALTYLENLRFTEDEVEWLRGTPALAQLDERFFEYLRTFRFTGDVWAIAEGTPVFPNEPLLRVTAPLPEAQLVETALLAIVSLQTTIASKTARIVYAADGRPVYEFGARRAHGPEAALLAARAAYVAGCAGTSYVEAGRRFGIPLSGTMAHSWVLAFEEEMASFRRYTDLFGDRAALLIDTYDTAAAARAIAASGLRPSAVRIDSGNLGALAREVRSIFDAHGLEDTRILLSGDLDEHRIRRLLADGAPVEGFGVGTALVTSEDAPALSSVYKLVELHEDGRTRGVRKKSPAKVTWPGAKQVWRRASGDVLGLADEPAPEGTQPLIERVMQEGRRTAPAPPLETVRRRCREACAALPPSLRQLDTAAPYPVRPSDKLAELMA
jgi:nicotinate phosphoribosyltransferase